MVNDVIDQDIFVLDDFFKDQELHVLEQVTASREVQQVVAEAGPFQGKAIVNYVIITDDATAVDFLRQKLFPVFGHDFSFDVIVKQTLFLPWDIHADYFQYRTPRGFLPWYNLLIPLEDIDSRTIIFDQVTRDLDDFGHYKDTHPRLSEPVDPEIWERYLSMCWPEDRYYVSIKRIMPAQRRGQLQAIPRWYFHSSDNWHVHYPGQSKSFIQVRLDRPCP